MKDDWRAETQLKLKENILFQKISEKCKIDPAGTKVMALIDDAVFDAYQRTKTIIRHMGEFTLHDGDHLFRVLDLMGVLLKESNIEKLSIPELMMLILSAFFHDIGMAPSEIEVISWRKFWDKHPTFTDSMEEESFNKFKRFCLSRPEQLIHITELIEEGKLSEADLIKSYLISEYIRQTHAIRAKEIIKQNWDEKIIYRDCDLTVEFAQICFSHNENALLLLDLDKNYLCGPHTFACLPLIGVILRLSDILDFDGKRTPQMLFSHLFVRHPISIKEWNKHRSIQSWNINTDLIQFHAKCTHPAIEASIHDFCDLIDLELSTCNNIISSLNEFNKARNLFIKLPFKVNRDKIETKKDILGNPIYLYRETQFNLSKKQVIDLLMGTKLYGNPEIALRELIQNSIDACLLRQALEKKWGNTYIPEILVRYSTENKTDMLEVIDNGIGMDQYIIDNYYSKIGISFYKSADFYELKSQSNADFTPTSRFGIGILSCFMVADTLMVDTRRVYAPHNSSEPLSITVEGQESIFWIRHGKRETPGTSTKLILRKTKNPWDRMSENEFIKAVETVIPNPPLKINIKTTSHEKVRDENSFKDITASSLKDYSWADNEYVRIFEVNINEKKKGILGSALVAILEIQDEPVDIIDINSKTIDIEGQSYSLSKNLKLGENKIVQESTSLTINDDGEIKEENSTQYFTSSKSKLSLHGIEVPTSLFPDYWSMKTNQVKLSWPFPLILVLDICGNLDLDLNSARTQILMSEKWIKVEEELAYIICLNIKKQVGVKYWLKLKKVLLNKTKNMYFKSALERVSKLKKTIKKKK